MVEFSKISIKTKNCKTFCKAQRAALRKLFSPPPQSHPPPDQTSLRVCNKNFLTEVYRNIHTFALKVLQECSSWASRNAAVQISFLTPNRNMFTGKFVKPEMFLAVLREHIIFNVKWTEACKMSEVFERNCIVKCVIFFYSFWWCTLERLDKYKNVACPK